MNPKIIDSAERKFIGMSLEMTYSNNTTGQLWGGFMPRRNEVQNRIHPGYFSLQGTNPAYTMYDRTVDRTFTKWALVEVNSFDVVPDGMETFVLPAGKYAVFLHSGKGVPAFIEKIKTILSKWLPSSGYQIDNRPDFEILEENARNNPEAEEEIWVPIK
ncbi:GyrI-like domain-containing protein [uncultured Arcticibacterium sp.]|uniref:GyrI-like domain-containing protein n=1 Tax=uncultured Arcticibacterium sp. TaxID=2173042 RepID=UPI0030F94505